MLQQNGVVSKEKPMKSDMSYCKITVGYEGWMVGWSHASRGKKARETKN
jgi:hypothetical protein